LMVTSGVILRTCLTSSTAPWAVFPASLRAVCRRKARQKVRVIKTNEMAAAFFMALPVPADTNLLLLAERETCQSLCSWRGRFGQAILSSANHQRVIRPKSLLTLGFELIEFFLIRVGSTFLQRGSPPPPPWRLPPESLFPPGATAGSFHVAGAASRVSRDNCAGKRTVFTTTSPCMLAQPNERE